MKAVVHNQKYNSPLGLYSAENVTETLVTQAKVLSNGGPISVVLPSMSSSSGVPGTKSSNVYRMVQNDDDEGKCRDPSYRSFSRSPILQSQSFLKLQQSLEEDGEVDDELGYSQSSPSGSPTYMNRRQPQAPPPPPPPKPMSATSGQKPGPGNWVSGPVQQPQAHYQQQQHQSPSQHQHQHQAGNYYQPSPQPQRAAGPGPTPQRAAGPGPTPQRAAAPGPSPHYSGPQTPPYSPVQPQYLSEQERYLQEQARLQQKPKYQPQYLPSQPQRAAAAGPQNAYNNVAPKTSSTFASIIPTEGSQPNAYGSGSGPQWSPTTGRKPVWPPPKSQEALLTSSQSVKWTGGSPAKKFIWPPPKGHVEVEEEMDDRGNVRTVYREVPESQRARTYVSPRAPTRLSADAWEPYSGQSDQNGQYQLESGPGRRLRRFNDIFTPNSTRLPPTYRAPPGTQHVEYE